MIAWTFLLESISSSKGSTHFVVGPAFHVFVTQHDFRKGGQMMEASNSHHGPFRQRVPSLFLAFVFWTAIGLVFALSRTGTGQGAWSVVMPALIEWWTWGILSPLIIAVDRKLPFYGERSLVHLLMHLVLGPLWILVFTFSSESICWGLGLQQWGHLFANFRQGMFWTMLIYLLIVGVSEADLFRQRHLSSELRMQRLGKNLSDAKLQALRMQLDPHFLFNALNTISAEVAGDPRLARKMIEHLGDLLRSSLELRDRPEVTLDDEMNLLGHFIAIQKARLGNDLRVILKIPIGLRSHLVPSLLLQPLVENAIRHGITPRVGGGTVTVEARTLNGHLMLSVSDDGVGLPHEWWLADKVGLGLAHTRERITGLYPNTKAELSISPREGGGTVVVVLLPIRENQDEVGPRESTRHTHFDR